MEQGHPELDARVQSCDVTTSATRMNSMMRGEVVLLVTQEGWRGVTVVVVIERGVAERLEGGTPHR